MANNTSRFVQKVKRFFVRIGIAIMPYIPLPWEPYRKILMRDSERRYGTGRWKYLGDISEAHRYSIISGCCDYCTSEDRKILDVGCGEGILADKVTYSKYLGVDVNAEAIRLAGIRSDASTEFVVNDAGQDHLPRELFDVIVFNESLYYMKNPADVFAKYRGCLAPEGIIIVCMFQTYLARKLWKQINKIGVCELTSVKISNDLGFSSTVKVYAR